MVFDRMRSTFLFVIICSFFFLIPFAKAASMKLLTPEVGWALAGPGLMWTTDGGNHWKNITPSLPSGQHITSVFFLNTQDGWALLSGPIKGSESPRLELAATNTAGASWSFSPVKVPGLNPRSFLLGGGGHIYFLDTLHGWMNLSLASSAAVRSAILIETRDGGRTWSWVASPGRSGPVFFADANDGWLAGGPAGKLYVTHDGSNTWREVSLKPPPEAGQAIYPTYGLPVIENGEDGFLPVTFSGTVGVHSALVMFRTSDGGRTWAPDTVVPISRQTSIGQCWPSAIVDSTLIAGSASGQVLALTRAFRGGIMSARASIGLSHPAFVGLSFVEGMRGWAMVASGGTAAALLATSDGGNTWTDITPHPPQKPFPPAKPPKWGPVDPLTGRPTGEGKPRAAAPSAAPTTQQFYLPSESSLTLAPEVSAAGKGGRATTRVSTLASTPRT